MAKLNLQQPFLRSSDDPYNNYIIFGAHEFFIIIVNIECFCAFLCSIFCNILFILIYYSGLFSETLL